MTVAPVQTCSRPSRENVTCGMYYTVQNTAQCLQQWQHSQCPSHLLWCRLGLFLWFWWHVRFAFPSYEPFMSLLLVVQSSWVPPSVTELTTQQNTAGC